LSKFICNFTLFNRYSLNRIPLAYLLYHEKNMLAKKYLERKNIFTASKINLALKNKRKTPHIANKTCCNLLPKNCPPLKDKAERKYNHKKSQDQWPIINRIKPSNPKA